MDFPPRTHGIGQGTTGEGRSMIAELEMRAHIRQFYWQTVWEVWIESMAAPNGVIKSWAWHGITYGVHVALSSHNQPQLLWCRN